MNAGSRECDAARARILDAVRAGERALVPLEVARLLALGGELGVDETCRQWLIEIAPAFGGRLSGAVGEALRELARSYGFEDRILLVAFELLDNALPSLLSSTAWRDLELGQRTQVLILFAFLADTARAEVSVVREIVPATSDV